MGYGFDDFLDPNSVSGSRIRIQGQENDLKTRPVIFVLFYQFYNKKVCYGSGSALYPDLMTLSGSTTLIFSKKVFLKIK
jgi:hypothetical protein